MDHDQTLNTISSSGNPKQDLAVASVTICIVLLVRSLSVIFHENRALPDKSATFGIKFPWTYLINFSRGAI
jgi:hypothetical protein